MSSKKTWLGVWIGILMGTVYLAAVGAEDGLAFVTEVKGTAHIVRAGGKEEKAAMGSQLFDGDALRVDKGKAALIYLSGRTATVAEGKTHKVQKEGGESSALMGRVMNTLGEIAGPQSEVDRPVVHGMARDMAGLSGALPTNTRLSRGDFSFSWDPLEGVEAYQFKLETAKGKVLVEQPVKGTSLPASGLDLKPGERYLWSVQETETFMMSSSDKGWVEVAKNKETKKLRQDLAEIEKLYSGDNQSLLKAALLFEKGFFYEAERLLVGLQKKRQLAEFEQRMLVLTYAKMERWERVPPAEGGEEDKKAPEKATRE